MGWVYWKPEIGIDCFLMPEKQQDTVKLQEIKSAPREHKRDAEVFKDGAVVVGLHLRLSLFTPSPKRETVHINASFT